MAFPARYKGTCSSCGKPIVVGQYITWSRREKGKAYHADCSKPDAKPVETATPASAVTPEMLMEMLAKLTAAKIPMTPVAETEPEGYAESALTPEAPEAPAPAKYTAAALDSNSPWFTRLEALIKGGIKRILLIGPPGTGKSKTALLLSGTDYEVTMTEGMSVEDLIGMFQLIDGATVWVDGPVIKAMREGKTVIVNEIDHHPTEISSLLYALMDDNPAVMLPTGERVVAATGYGVIGTSNANVVALPDAILDRCDAVLNAVMPHSDALALIENKQEQATCFNYFKTMDVTPWRWSRKPTLRTMRAFQRMKPIVGADIAAECAFGAAAAEMLSVISTASRTGAKDGE
jgi:nitric oxide reductase NorQ protein